MSAIRLSLSALVRSRRYWKESRLTDNGAGLDDPDTTRGVKIGAGSCSTLVELTPFSLYVHHTIDGRRRGFERSFRSSVSFQTQYVRNKILSIAALDYKIRHGAMGGS